MLTEQEWETMVPILNQAISDVQGYRQAYGTGLDKALQQGFEQEALALYRDLTGFAETNLDAIRHHRLSLYGPTCTACGKPLRTPQATFCAACGTSRA